jgi:hypothetical protein
MRLKNYTNISDDKVREIIQFVKPSSIANFDVRISNSEKDIFRGRAYSEGSPYHDTTNPFIVVRVTKDESAFPYFVRYESYTRTKFKINPQSGKFESVSYNTGTGGYINHILLSREEVIVHVVAHELRHLWQAKVKRGYRVWGARGQFSDRDADAYAIRKTRKWRRREKQTTGCFRYELIKYLLPKEAEVISSTPENLSRSRWWR